MESIVGGVSGSSCVNGSSGASNVSGVSDKTDVSGVSGVIGACGVKDLNALTDLASFAVDAALCEGLLFRTAEQPHSSDLVQFVPFSLFPSPVPR